MSLAICQRAVLLSDIDFLRWYIANNELDDECQPFVDRELPLYDFSLSDEAYRAHYEYWEGKFYRGPVQGMLQKNWAMDSRFHQIYTSMFGTRWERVLDFGCSTGHITRLLAERFPETDFIGTDLIPEGLRIFNELAPANARAMAEIDGYFDLILATEVIEHVREPYATLDWLATYLRPGGKFLLTLPNGPWEAQGYDANPGGREHLRHWNIDDLHDVFGEVDASYVSCGQTSLGEVGNVCCVSGPRVGAVDMQRKLTRFYQSVEPQQGFG